MERRLKLDAEFRAMVNNVYYQPGPSVKLKYPCIIYQQSNGKTRFAGNMPYTFQEKYDVTLIDRNPDTELVRELAMHFPMIVMDRAYTADNLYHYAYTLYY